MPTIGKRATLLLTLISADRRESNGRCYWSLRRDRYGEEVQYCHVYDNYLEANRKPGESDLETLARFVQNDKSWTGEPLGGEWREVDVTGRGID